MRNERILLLLVSFVFCLIKSAPMAVHFTLLSFSLLICTWVKWTDKKPSCVSRSLRACRRSVSLSPPVPRLSPRHTPLLTVTGVSRVNDGTEGGEGTETPRDRREHGERRAERVWGEKRVTARRALASLVTFSLPSPHNPLRYSVLFSHPPSPLYGRVSTRSTPYRRPKASGPRSGGWREPRNVGSGRHRGVGRVQRL